MAMPPTKSVAELEAAISKALIRFEKECMGRGPFETKTYLLDDMIVVRLKGVLLPSEIQLAESEENPHRARLLLKEVRQMILERARPLLESVIVDIVGVPVLSVHTDISTRTGERLIIFTLKGRVEIVAERNGWAKAGRATRDNDLDASVTGQSSTSAG